MAMVTHQTNFDTLSLLLPFFENIYLCSCIFTIYTHSFISYTKKCDPHLVPVFAACHGLLVRGQGIRVMGSV